ncbi:sugar transferase [Candidatus Gottesmanbacteria bacterium]|nr:sugar transferase [Candidatus Gottesmanbacteria bacterium]
MITLTKYEKTKRIIDLFGAFGLLIFFLPLCLLIAFLIKLDSDGPIFADTPERVGKKGTLFKMYKFRSMVESAHELLRTSPKYKELFVRYKRNSYKLPRDPRITNIGRFIRRHSLDEIPQLLNVLRGEMSLVGPRAYYPDELREQQKKYPHTQDLVKVVLSIRPGITGVWQVSGRSEVNFDKRIAMDAEYVKNKSLFYDMIIILKTPFAMISGRGAM